MRCHTIFEPRTHNALVLAVIISALLTACRKDEAQPTVNTYYYQGVLRDVDGNAVAGGSVLVCHSCPSPAGSEVLQTDANGWFRGSISWAPDEHQGYVPPAMSNQVTVSATVGEFAGYHRFLYGDLSLSTTLQTDITLDSVGYLQVQMVDTGQTINATLTAFGALPMDASINFNTSMADTTFLIRAFGDTYVRTVLNFFGYAQSDTILVAGGDTTVKVVTY